MSASKPGLTGAMIARAEAHVMRLAWIYALADKSDTIRTDHLKAALSLWDYSEQSVRIIFGVKTGDPLADKIYVLVKNAGGKMDRLTAINATGRNYPKVQFDLAIDTLVRAGLLREETVGQGGKGRPKIILTVLR